MKHLKYIVMAFAVALFAASCSQDELLDDGGTEEVPVTFTATRRCLSPSPPRWIRPSKHKVTMQQGI